MRTIPVAAALRIYCGDCTCTIDSLVIKRESQFTADFPVCYKKDMFYDMERNENHIPADIITGNKF